MHIIARLLRFWPGLAIVSCGALVLTWGFWQPARAEKVLDFTTSDMLHNVLSANVLEGQLENRRMMLQYPTWMRLSDPAKVRLTFDILPLDGISTPPDVTSAAYDIFVEASLDMPGLQVEPPYTAGAALPASRAVTFWWTVEARQSGEYDGTAWLRLRYQSQDGKVVESKTLAAPRLQVDVQRCLFLSGPAARWLGGLALVSGSIWITWRWAHA